MPGERPLDPEYVAARRVLLDALEALGTHRKAVVLVGARAIYLHVGEGDLAVSPYTTDGDLAIDPRQLDDEPALTGTLEAAGFELTVAPARGARTMFKSTSWCRHCSAVRDAGARGSEFMASTLHGRLPVSKGPSLIMSLSA